MKRAALRLACFWAVLLASQTILHGHHRTPREVVEELNQEQTKSKTGIVAAAIDKKMGRLLWIRVGPKWYQQSGPERERLARDWLKMWKDAVPNGIVSVIDATTGEPVVNYHPSGKVSLSSNRGPSPGPKQNR